MHGQEQKCLILMAQISYSESPALSNGSWDKSLEANSHTGALLLALLILNSNMDE